MKGFSLKKFSCVLAFFVGAYAWANVTQAQQNAALVSVDAVIEQELTQTVPIVGRLVARQSGTVATRTGGAVQGVMAHVGDRVKKDQVLARLSTRALELQKQLALAQLAEAKARLRTAKAQLALAGQEVRRLGQLKNSASTTKAAYDDAKQSQNIAFARVREAEAAMATSDASVNLADLNLSYSEIKAPYSGVVTERLTEAGSFLQTGQGVVVLVSDENLELEADVPYNRLQGLDNGNQVEIVLDNDTRHTAIVRAIVPQENPRTRTRAVRFIPEFGVDSGTLAVEQSATVLIPLGAERDIVSVHKDAVIRRGQQSLVYVVADEVAEMRPVQLGEAVGNRFEVLQGLEVGDATVIRGNERLRPNQKVRVSS